MGVTDIRPSYLCELCQPRRVSPVSSSNMILTSTVYNKWRCLYNLLPVPHDTESIPRLRAPSKFPRIANRTKKYQSFMSCNTNNPLSTIPLLFSWMPWIYLFLCLYWYYVPTLLLLPMYAICILFSYLATVSTINTLSYKVKPVPCCFWQEVKLKARPPDSSPLCTYYMTLLQSSQRQIRLGDFVYIAPSDLLLPPGDCWMKHIDDLGIYSVERLWCDARYAVSHSPSLFSPLFRVSFIFDTFSKLLRKILGRFPIFGQS